MTQPSLSLLKIFLGVTVLSNVITFLGVVLGWILQLGDLAGPPAFNTVWAVTQWVFPGGVATLVLALTLSPWWSLIAFTLVAAGTIFLLVRGLHWRPRDQIALMAALGLAGPALNVVALASLAAILVHSWIGQFFLGLIRSS